jgi:7-cyano-7-deazaguanine synthase
MSDLAIVLVSGGVDSCVTTTIASSQYKLAFLHVNYGQRTESRELKAFNDIASYYDIPKDRILVSTIDYFSKIGGSSLTDLRMNVQRVKMDSNEIPTSYVPFRNTLFLTIAVSWGEVIGARKIFIGAVEQDSPDYPDCRPAYYETFNNLIRVGTRPTTFIKVETPLISLCKSEIIKRGISLKAPLHLTWSCYKNTDKACGICHSCFQRLKAFQDAGIRDSIPYRD